MCMKETIPTEAGEAIPFAVSFSAGLIMLRKMKGWVGRSQ